MGRGQGGGSMHERGGEPPMMKQQTMNDADFRPHPSMMGGSGPGNNFGNNFNNYNQFERTNTMPSQR